jgi:hypothetical protein
MPKKLPLIIIIAAAILPTLRQCRSAETTPLSDSEINAKLAALKPLPKIHYYWPPDANLLETRDSRRLYELARITHSLCVSGEWATPQQTDNCVYTCARVNKTSPGIKCVLGINFSPWHMKFDPNLPPTDRGPSYLSEINFFEGRCRLIQKWIAQSNEKYHSNVEVGALTLDTERFQEKAGDKTWNEGIRQALDAIHIKAASLFPGVRIEWYDRGILRVASGNGWAKSQNWTGGEIKTSLSYSAYSVPEIGDMRELFRRTCKLADEMHVLDVTPWVALASGYRRGFIKTYFDFNWDYDIIYSYLIGAELNMSWYAERPERFAPYNRAKVVVFYPPPFDKRTPHWGKHFIAYVRGATGVEDLNDLGYEQ